MDFLKLAKKRRSVRDFSSRLVKDEDLTDIFDAARWAPSANNRQNWRFIVVRDKSVKKKVVQHCYSQSSMANAAVLIVACSMPGIVTRQFPKNGEKMAVQGTAAAIQNMLLAATEKGIASCWCGVSAHKGLHGLLNIPGDMSIEAVIALGYASNRRIAPIQRFDVHDIIFYGEWGELEVDYSKNEIGEHTKPLLERKTVKNFKSQAKRLRTKLQGK
jgi:nitroreductase